MTKFLGLPPLASEHGADVDKFILYVHWVMGALFIGWLVYFVYVLIRFRSSRNPKASYIGTRSHASSYIEAAVVFLEAVLLIGFSIPLWAKAVDQFPPESESTVVRVIAEQFVWNAHYPGEDGVFGRQEIELVSGDNPYGLVKEDPNGFDDREAPRNEIVVPVNKPVIIHVSSKDVVHSFKVNAFRICQDAIPGLQIPLWFTPTKEGNYLVNCAQLCGNSHYYMKGYLRVVNQQEYEAWLSELRPLVQQASATGGSPFE